MSRKGNILQTRISAKLITIFLAISIIPIAIVGVISVNSSYNALEEAQFNQLKAVGTLKTIEVVDYFHNKFIELDVLSKSGDALMSYRKLNDFHDNGGALADGSYKVSGSKYEKIYSEIDPFFSTFLKSFHFNDLYIVCVDHGHIMYSSERDDDMGSNLSNGKYNQSGLAKVWREVKESKKPVLVDFSYFEVIDEPAAFMGAPLFDENNELLAVIVLEINKDKIDEIMMEDTGLGETGETYLVGDDYLMRTDSRFSKESTILNQKVETESVKLAHQGMQGVHIIEDYRGIKTLSYYSHLKFDEEFKADFDWVMISEMDAEEAFHEAVVLKNELLIISIIIGLLIALIAFFFARYFTKPIIKLTSAAEAFALGDLRQEFDIKNKDELGILSYAFKTMQLNMIKKADQALKISEGNLTIEVETLSDKDEMGKAFKIMIENLRGQINGINEVVSVLTTSNSQLMSTISELSSSSSETSTTVAEVTSTIEEVKQTAEVATQKAKNVANAAQKSVSISEKGIKSTEDSIEGMEQIQEQVKKIAETIIRLSEQSQTIGEITNSVNDIAEQSNLLAVNASIEAVKAGEYGKGFGVVAQEIRALADESKQSTKQIRDILSEVQKAISSAVMATEQGGKAVEKGMNLSESTGDSISVLADSISEAAQASTQIAASSQQQLTGMEQLTVAMENIKQASSQNAAGAKQAEEAVDNIKSIVHNLKVLVEKYKLNN